MKTIVFTMFLKGWDIRNQQVFHSKIIKNHACNPNMLSDTSNHRKYQTVTQNGLQRETRNPSKIIKIHSDTLQGPPECICAPLDHQNGLQGPPNRPKMVSLGTQIDIKINKSICAWHVQQRRCRLIHDFRVQLSFVGAGCLHQHNALV